MTHNINIKVEALSNSCFIIMPFNALFKIQYENIIKPAVLELGLDCIRGDEIYSEQRIVDDIWNSLKSCRLVIAELTGRSPNVLYEIGLAHALGKPVIILTREANDVPFDLKDLRYLFYDVNDPFWGENLHKGLQNLIQKVLENPQIGSYLKGISQIEISSFPKIKEVKKIKESKIEVINLEGIWKANWVSPKLLNKHQLILTISQKGKEISGSGIVSKTKNNTLTVIQEIFHGTVTAKALTLVGVNYSYIERGDSSDYFLDTFEIKIADSNKMTGSLIDIQGNSLEHIEFNKVTNLANL